MNTTPLIEILDHLTEEEITTFSEYLQSSFHSTPPLAMQLWEILSQNSAKWQPEAATRQAFLDRRHLYSRLYPDTAFRGQRIRRISMELTQALKAFFAQQHHQQRHWLTDEVAFLRELLRRRLYHRFPKAFRQVQRRIAAAATDDPAVQLHIAEIYRLDNEYHIHARSEQDTFAEVQTALDRHYLANKLETWASMRTREKRYAQRHPLSFQAETEAMLAQAPLDAWPEVRIWQEVQALETPGATRAAYQKLETSLARHAQVLPLEKLRQVRGYMFNFLNRNIRTDQRSDYRQCWQLLCTMLAEGTLHISGRLSEAFMRVAVRSACFAGEVAWAARFIADYGKDLVGPDKVQVLAILRVIVLHYQGHYRKVLREINLLSYSQPRFEILLRICQLKSLYALDDADAFFRRGEAFQKYLRRKGQLSERIRVAHASFVEQALRLGQRKFYGEGKLERAADLRASPASEKIWLLEKLAVLVD